MKPSLRRLGTVAGITCAIAGIGPVASSIAATPGAPSPTPSTFPGLSCSVNQGLLPGIPNVGPTGPLGPLGSSGPTGSSSNLPCGTSVLNLGPTGPLGPGGALGPGSAPAQQTAPGQQATPGQQAAPAAPGGSTTRSPAKHTHRRSKAGHLRAHGHGKRVAHRNSATAGHRSRR